MVSHPVEYLHIPSQAVLVSFSATISFPTRISCSTSLVWQATFERAPASVRRSHQVKVAALEVLIQEIMGGYSRVGQLVGVSYGF